MMMTDNHTPTVKEDVTTSNGVTPPQPKPKTAPKGTALTAEKTALTAEPKTKPAPAAFVKDEVIQATFLANPLVEYFYFTATGQAFFTADAAQAAAPADNRQVVRIDNPQKSA